MRSISSPAPQKATQVTHIPTGTYQIVNLHTGAYAGLLDDNDRSEVVNLILELASNFDQGSIVSCDELWTVRQVLIVLQWRIKHIRSDDYVIQSVDFKSYASYDPSPKLSDPVLGKWEVAKEWRIRVIAKPDVCMSVVLGTIHGNTTHHVTAFRQPRTRIPSGRAWAVLMELQ